MIWLLEDILKQLPRGLHDWNKFIKPDELSELMRNIGFSDIVIKGFDITDGTNFETLKNIVARGLNNQRQGEKPEFFKIQINEDTSVCYIGKTVKR
jgi:2-polyprenyl-6-hydroxyphenyl methylase/3-demethylubiquinone-9 3-methyltransferase